MKRLNQSGFAALTGLLGLVIIVLIIATGWYVWQSKQDTDSTLKSSNSVADSSTSVTQMTYTDTANTYSFVYPSDWKVDEQTEPAGEGPVPDYSKESAAIVLYAPNKTNNDVTDMIAYNSDATYDVVIGNAKKDSMHTITQTTINGHRAIIDVVKFVGPSEAEKYTDHLYYIENGEEMLMASYRESYYHNYPKANWSDSKDLADFNNIIKSIQFTE